MKEHPILFSTDMVKAILDGRKTMTRRTKGLDKYNEQPDEWTIGRQELAGKVWWEAWKDNSFSHRIDCPYGQVGDRLWVRESFFYGSGDYDNRTCVIRYAVDNVEIEYKIPDGFLWDKTCKWCYTKLDGSHPIRPSIHMPRWASRITLEITEVRVERVQEISGEDAMAEGIETMTSPNGKIFYSAPQCGNRPAQWEAFAEHAYMWLWDSLNAKKGYGWEVNPWLWVISFKVVK